MKDLPATTAFSKADTFESLLSHRTGLNRALLSKMSTFIWALNHLQNVGHPLIRVWLDNPNIKYNVVDPGPNSIHLDDTDSIHINLEDKTMSFQVEIKFETCQFFQRVVAPIKLVEMDPLTETALFKWASKEADLILQKRLEDIELHQEHNKKLLTKVRKQRKIPFNFED
jgi:hypothetical protein